MNDIDEKPYQRFTRIENFEQARAAEFVTDASINTQAIDNAIDAYNIAIKAFNREKNARMNLDYLQDKSVDIFTIIAGRDSEDMRLCISGKNEKGEGTKIPLPKEEILKAFKHNVDFNHESGEIYLNKMLVEMCKVARQYNANYIEILEDYCFKLGYSFEVSFQQGEKVQQVKITINDKHHAPIYNTAYYLEFRDAADEAIQKLQEIEEARAFGVDDNKH